jgi:glutathione synthase/RimK-type ligase-like ATP-grasp enzyme
MHLNRLQLAHVLPTLATYSYISIPPTTIIKGIGYEKVTSPPQDRQYITKFLSDIRSIVVNNSTFRQWDKEGIQNLPTLFQEHIKGIDWRIQVCGDQVFAVKINKKDAVDYRYAVSVSFEEVKPPPQVITFCMAVSQFEDNPCMGIDLIQTDCGDIFLEANPAPGWDYYFKETSRKEQVCRAILALAK